MALFSSESFKSLDDLLLHQIQDLYDAEHRIADTLPKMVDKASIPALKQKLESHVQSCSEHKARIEQMFKALGKDAERDTCQATVGLIKETQGTLDATGDPEVIDAALIANAQRIEHYEIAGYGTIKALAKQAGHDQIATLADQCLGEEIEQDEELTRVAENTVNPAAAN